MATEGAMKRVRTKSAKATVSKGIASVTVGELRSNFKTIEAQLAKGGKVQITRRGEVVAEIQAPTSSVAGVAALPDFNARLKRIWGERPWEIDTTAMVSEGRGRVRVP